MIYFFGNPTSLIYAVKKTDALSASDIEKLQWLFGGHPLLRDERIAQAFSGPRASMITPWSTNATEIIENMGIQGVIRVEQFNALMKRRR